MEFAVNNCLFSWLLSTTSSCVAALANPISLNVPFLYFFVGMCCGVCPCFVVVFLPFHMAIASLRSKCFWNCCSVIWGIALSLHVTFSCIISMIQIACKSLFCSILEALCMGHRLFSFLLQFLWFHYHSLQVQSIDATRWWKCFQENILLFGLGPSRSRKPDSSKMYFII